MIRVLIADDHKLIRDAYRALLRSDRDIQIVGEARDGMEAIKLTVQLAPDVVLMDVAMPVLDGFSALKQIRQSHHNVHVIMVSMDSDENNVHIAMRTGAIGYVSKSDDFGELASAIHNANEGQTFLSSSISKILAFND
jgi:DNA-binding NarL/FixJ family response regulator